MAFGVAVIEVHSQAWLCHEARCGYSGGPPPFRYQGKQKATPTKAKGATVSLRCGGEFVVGANPILGGFLANCAGSQYTQCFAY
jgi:hypothetical protein